MRPSTRYSIQEWDSLIGLADGGRTGQGAIFEATRRLIEPISAADETASKLQRSAHSLSWLMGIFSTIVTAFAVIEFLGLTGSK